MLKPLILSLFIFKFLTISLYGQELDFWAKDHADSFGTHKPMTLNMEDCTQNVPNIIGGEITSVPAQAIGPLGAQYLIRDDITDMSQISFALELSLISYSLFPTTTNANLYDITGMTCTPDNIYYVLGTKVGSWSPDTEIYTELGLLPADLQCIGGVTYRLGEIYYSTASNDIVKLNIEDVSASEVVFTLPDDVPPLETLTTVHNTCSDVTTFGTVASDTGTVFYELDFETESLTEYCVIPDSVTAMTNVLEAVVPPCEVNIDLNPSPIAQNNLTDTICVPPINIVGETVSLYSELGYIDSVRVFISAGLFNAGEHLTIQNPTSNIVVTQASPSELLLTNGGEATELDFAQALSLIVYHNDSDTVTDGLRTVSFIAYSSVYASSATKSFIPVFNEILQTNAVLTNPLCNDESTGSISLNPTGGEEPFSIVWNDGSSDLSLSNLSSSNYSVTIEDNLGCINSETFTLENPLPLSASISNVGGSSVCDTFGILSVEAEGGTGAYNFQWSNGKTEMTATGFTAGLHTVTVSDVNGCETVTDFTLAAGEGTQTDISASICSDETYLFENIELSSDTTFCLTLQDVAGCDSLVCLDLIVYENTPSDFAYSLCAGEEFEIEGDVYTTDTLVCITYQNQNNCDSTVCTDLTFLETVEYFFAEICEGEAYTFGTEVYTESGNYEITYSDVNGCDSTEILNLTVFENPMPQIMQTGSLCAGQESELSLTADYVSVAWSTGSTDASISVNESNIYAVSVTDENTCQGTVTYTVNENSIEAEYSYQSPSCFGDSDGQIVLTNVTGGEEPYLLSIEGSTFSEDFIFTDLSAGEYQVILEDAQGCIRETLLILDTPNPIEISLDEEVYLDLGDSISIRPVTGSTVIDSAIWSPADYVSCDTCLETFIQPLETSTFTLLVKDTSGCQEEVDITAVVNRDIVIFAPTAISPNFDGINDIFYLQSKNDLRINQMRIYDSWGTLLYSQGAGFTNDASYGWGSENNAIEVENDTFIWYAEVVFPDGRIEVVKGDFVVL